MLSYYGRDEHGELKPLVSLRIDWLARQRKGEGVKIRQQARDMGIDVSNLYGYRSGYRTPEVDNLRKICSYYGVSADWLIGLKGGA